VNLVSHDLGDEYPDFRGVVRTLRIMTERPATPAQAIAELRAGNQRFVTGTARHPNQDADHRAALAEAQTPFAVIFGCSDSRLAAEIIFDRGLGDLFVVRTAGHVVGAEVLGSIEYGVAVLGCPLVVVLGHDSCGAVGAACDAVDNGTTPDGYVRDVVERVMPSVLAARAAGLTTADDILAEHVKRTVELLLDRSQVIAERVRAGQTAVVGLRYRLADGSAQVAAAHGSKELLPSKPA
jgi:carbonic anhydrase